MLVRMGRAEQVAGGSGGFDFDFGCICGSWKCIFC